MLNILICEVGCGFANPQTVGDAAGRPASHACNIRTLA